MADHIVYRCVSMRYTDGVENFTAGSTVDPASSSVSVPGAASSGTRRIVVAVAAHGISGTTLQGSSSWVSDDVDVTAEAFFVWCNTDVGHGGGLFSGSGLLDGAGASGSWSSSLNAASLQACMSFACFGSDPSNLPQTYDTSTGSGVDDVVVSLPIRSTGFYLVLLVQTANEEVEISAGTGWTLRGSVGVGTAGAAGSTRLTIFTADADESPTAPTLSIVAGGDPGIEGTLSATLGAATASGTGAVAVAGSLAATLGAATVVATGAAPIAGAASPTLAAATVAGSGAVAIAGGGGGTLDDATLEATGAAAVTGTLTSTLAAASLAASGGRVAIGQLAVTLADATLVAAGNITEGALVELPARTFLRDADEPRRIVEMDARSLIIADAILRLRQE